MILLLSGISFLEAQYDNLNFFHITHKQGLSSNAVLSITKDSDGYMWFGTSNGLNRYDGYEFETFYKTDDSTSIPDNEVSHIFLTAGGTLYIGTDSKGMCWYNPVSQSFIRHSFVSDHTSFGADNISGFAEDSDSVLYVATFDGLFSKESDSEFFNEVLLSFDDVDSSNASSVPTNKMISAIDADEGQGIWIAFEDWWISHYNNTGTFKHYSLQQFQKENQQTKIMSICSYNNKVYIGTLGAGFMVLDPNSGNVEPLLNNEYLYAIFQVKTSLDSLLWLTTGSGLISYNPENEDYYRFTNIVGDNKSLSTTPVNSVFEDENGIIWVGSSNAGINYSFKHLPFHHFYVGLDTYFTLQQDNVTAILIDNNGDLWVGYQGGIIEYNRYKEKRKYQVRINALTGKTGPGSIFDIFQDSENNVYALSWLGGLQVFDRENNRFVPVSGTEQAYYKIFDGVDIRGIDEDKQGRLWLTMHGKGVYIYDKMINPVNKLNAKGNDSTSLTNDWVYDICIDDNGFVWVGSAWGLTRISQENLKTRKYYSTEDTFSLSNNLIRMIKKDRNGNIWVGTDNGLNLYNREKDVFHRFNEKHGLPSNQIRSMEQDFSGSFWVSTSSGIFKFDLVFDNNGIPSLAEIYPFQSDDGLQSDFFYYGCSAIDQEGTIFFGGRNGIDYFDPSTIKPVEIKPSLRIKSFEIFGEKIYPGSTQGPPINEEGEVLLHYTQNMIGFEYVALNYFDVRENQYSYKLSPVQNHWVNAKNNRNIVFSNLGPGHYSLSLKVITSRSTENEVSDIIKLFIKPPFWQTAWFIYLSIIFILAFILILIRLYTQNLRKKKVQLESTVQQRTAELIEKNILLTEQSNAINETNTLLEERQQHIEEQAEELKTQAERLEISNNDLVAANAMKDKFFSIIAHDLINPFNVIMGFTGLLRDKSFEYPAEKKQKIIEDLHTTATETFSLLQNLLHWSRSQAGRLKMYPRKLNLLQLIEINHRLVAQMLKRKKIAFSIDIEKNLEVFADEELLNTVIRNLLSNAIKFTPENGSILIRSAGYNNGMVISEVKDTGVGIGDEKLKDMFNVDNSSSQKGTEGEKGTGLGMVLCKEFVEKMGGQIWIESKPGGGTSVFFTVPAKE